MGCCPAGCQGSQGCLGDAAVCFLVGAASVTSERGNGVKGMRPALSTGAPGAPKPIRLPVSFRSRKTWMK